jgi:hypothetical protein
MHGNEGVSPVHDCECNRTAPFGAVARSGCGLGTRAGIFSPIETHVGRLWLMFYCNVTRYTPLPLSGARRPMSSRRCVGRCVGRCVPLAGRPESSIFHHTPSTSTKLFPHLPAGTFDSILWFSDVTMSFLLYVEQDPLSLAPFLKY